MRLPKVLYVAMAALFIAAVAYAAKPQTATADIQALAASGINGSADMKIDDQGFARVHEQVSGLQAGVQYESVLILGSTTCGSGSTTVILEQFTANGAGKANFNTVVPPQVTPIAGGNASISVQRVSDNALLACGQVVTQ